MFAFVVQYSYIRTERDTVALTQWTLGDVVSYDKKRATYVEQMWVSKIRYYL